MDLALHKISPLYQRQTKLPFLQTISFSTFTPRWVLETFKNHLESQYCWKRSNWNQKWYNTQTSFKIWSNNDVSLQKTELLNRTMNTQFVSDRNAKQLADIIMEITRNRNTLEHNEVTLELLDFHSESTSRTRMGVQYIVCMSHRTAYSAWRDVICAGKDSYSMNLRLRTFWMMSDMFHLVTCGRP